MGIKDTSFFSRDDKTANQQQDNVFWREKNKNKIFNKKEEGKIKARYHKDSTILNQSLNYFEGNLAWFTVQDLLQVDHFLLMLLSLADKKPRAKLSQLNYNTFKDILCYQLKLLGNHFQTHSMITLSKTKASMKKVV